MLAIDIGPMIDRGLDDNYGPILACYIGPKIPPDYTPRITARVKPTMFQIYNDIINDNKISNLAYYQYQLILILNYLKKKIKKKCSVILCEVAWDGN